MLSVDARFSDTRGNGVGRWRLMYRVEDVEEARRWCRDLVQSAQVRVRDGKEIVVTPRRASEFTGESEAEHDARMRMIR